METAEHNSKIAEYMGAIWKQDDYEKWGYFYPEKSPNYNPYQSKESLKYHKSWDWIMPVVQKILSEETDGPCTFQLHVSDSLLYAKIEKVYEAVISYINYKTPPPADKQG